ncbi:MAG TPA: MBL fold metallo-hydrolase [Bacteroidia bacterium]|nr:MBL fold metallo-hydrolase [Bacteroidia bacterium]
MGILKSMGKNPSGERLKKVQASSNYRDNMFQNQSITLVMNGRGDFFKVLGKFLNKPKNVKPPRPLPAVKTDLKNLPDGNPVLVWFGHSSYLIKIDGKHILVDPVFSGYASPFKMGSAKSFDGTNVYNVEDMPPIDVLLITHDHYDHCDYKTVLQLNSKTKYIITSLGVGSHLEYWGFNMNKVTELDWNESAEKIEGIKFTSAPARHFSGRDFKRAKTLWASFILKTKNHSIYLGADSGYDKHFKEIGEKHGPFDLAILESGQYNEMWHGIHMMPEETVQASIDLKATTLLPVHWGKFCLSLHPWNEPIERVIKKAGELNVKLATPMIGETIIIGEKYPAEMWWRKVAEN